MTGFRHLVAYVQNGFVFELDQDKAIARQMRPRPPRTGEKLAGFPNNEQRQQTFPGLTGYRIHFCLIPRWVIRGQRKSITNLSMISLRLKRSCRTRLVVESVSRRGRSSRFGAMRQGRRRCRRGNIRETSNDPDRAFR